MKKEYLGLIAFGYIWSIIYKIAPVMVAGGMEILGLGAVIAFIALYLKDRRQMNEKVNS